MTRHKWNDGYSCERCGMERRALHVVGETVRMSYRLPIEPAAPHSLFAWVESKRVPPCTAELEREG